VLKVTIERGDENVFVLNVSESSVLRPQAAQVAAS
jgi:hypothetical protein